MSVIVRSGTRECNIPDGRSLKVIAAVRIAANVPRCSRSVIAFDAETFRELLDKILGYKWRIRIHFNSNSALYRERLYTQKRF